MQTLEDVQSKDLLFWANRYHLFVSWSSDRSHPWDAKQAASEYVTLEIGVARGTASKVRARARGSNMPVCHDWRDTPDTAPLHCCCKVRCAACAPELKGAACMSCTKA